MLHILFTLASASNYYSFSDGFQPPAQKDCETILIANTCWGPSVATENVCLWEATDGLCSEASFEDMESTCGIFMEPSSCLSRRFCAWNDGDLKCDAHELTTENEYADAHYLDCPSLPQANCNDYGGYGTECGWHAWSGTCKRGYAGNVDFLCQAFSSTSCLNVGICWYDNTLGCIGRDHIPGGIPEGNYDYSNGESPTLKKIHPTPKTVIEIDYRFGALVVIGLFIGLLIGTASMYMCTKSSGHISPVPLIEAERQI